MFDKQISGNKELQLVKTDCNSEYTLFLFSDGRIYGLGINEHGRMVVCKKNTETSVPIPVTGIPPIGKISSGPFHTGFIDNKEQLYNIHVM